MCSLEDVKIDLQVDNGNEDENLDVSQYENEEEMKDNEDDK